MQNTAHIGTKIVISFIALVAFTPIMAFAYYDGGFAGYGGGGGSFFFPTSPTGRQELYVHSWGPSEPLNYLSPAQQYPTYQNYAQPQGSYYPQQYTQQYPQQYQQQTNPYLSQVSNPSFDAYQSKFVNFNYVVPQMAAMPSFMSAPSYGYSNTSYALPSYTNSYSNPSYGYSGYGGYGGQPVQGTDFWGNQMCAWGSDYGNFPCDRDPRQYVYDPYTGTYY